MVHDEPQVRKLAPLWSLRKKIGTRRGVFVMADLNHLGAGSDVIGSPTLADRNPAKANTGEQPKRTLQKKLSQLFGRGSSSPERALRESSPTLHSGDSSRRGTLSSHTLLGVCEALQPPKARHRSESTPSTWTNSESSLRLRTASTSSLTLLTTLTAKFRHRHPLESFSPGELPFAFERVDIGEFDHADAYLICLEGIYDDFEDIPEKSSRHILAVIAHEITVISRTSKSEAERLMAVEAFQGYLFKRFNFHEVPLDISLRLLLFRCNLPKETGEIDFFMAEFARYWYDTNCALPKPSSPAPPQTSPPSPTLQPVFGSPDQVYMLAFALLILHTDHHNPNVKPQNRMSKSEFLASVRESLALDEHPWTLTNELLEYFYDNITFRPFSKYTKTDLAFKKRYMRKNSVSGTVPRHPFAMAELMHLLGRVETGVAVPEASKTNPYPAPTVFDIGASMIFNYVYYVLTTDHPPVQMEVTQDRSDWLQNSRSHHVPPLEPEATITARVARLGVVYKPNDRDPASAKGHLKLYAILTTTGLYLFKPQLLLSLFNVAQQELNELCVYFNSVGDEQQATTLCDSAFPPLITSATGAYTVLNPTIKPYLSYSLHGLFSTTEEVGGAPAFAICGRHTKQVFCVADEAEQIAWCESINIISALDNVHLPLAGGRASSFVSGSSLERRTCEITNRRTVWVGEKTLRYTEAREEASSNLLGRYLGILNFLSTLVAPLQPRTRELLEVHAKLMVERVDASWYELHKSNIMIGILQQLELLLPNPATSIPATRRS